MSELRRYAGLSASVGRASGPAFIPDAASPNSSLPDVTPDMKEALSKAIDNSIAALKMLADQSDQEGAAILEYQIEMLLDPLLTQMAMSRTNDAFGLALAWAGALDDYIADIEQSDEEHVRARAVDVVDIKNRVLRELTGTVAEDFPVGSVYVGKDIEPSRFLSHDWSKGGAIVLFNGSLASHVAMLARSRSVPMVVATGTIPVRKFEQLRVDGALGEVVIGADAASGVLPAILAGAGTGQGTSAATSPDLETADGVPVKLFLNINDPAELAGLSPSSCCGIGLMRTEFLMSSLADIANEDMQHQVYRDALVWAFGKPVTIRMLDLGGDKQIAGIGASDRESFLGLRGVRLLLARPEIARVQIRALLRAATDGDLKVLLPMVTFADEFVTMRHLFEEEAAHLSRRAVLHKMPSLGIMVEVPAAALMLDTFTDVGFFSLGTNDLAQYLTAAARDNPAVAGLYQRAGDSVLRLIENTVLLCKNIGKPISICGDMAGEVSNVAALLRTGLRQFSMAPSRLFEIRARIARLNADGSQIRSGVNGA